MFLSMNWIQDFVDLSGLDKIELIRKFLPQPRLKTIFSARAVKSAVLL